MRIDDFPESIRERIVPKVEGQYVYRCFDCQSSFSVDRLLYTCPECKGVLMIEDTRWERLKETPGIVWRRIFDYRRMVNESSLRGIYRYHELLGSIIPLDAVVYLGEAHTPIVHANSRLIDWAGCPLAYKNDGQNPSASFKDRGMASAYSYLRHLIVKKNLQKVLAVCASTGDTSAASALYASYLAEGVTSVVLLPKGKVTPQQLGQPLGSGAVVLEIPGVFDDCMKVVEYLADHYRVALMNSKNAWRILGQESYSYEIAQDMEYDLASVVVVVPIGNAGNITAVMGGFLKLHDLGIITSLPKILGVQSEHANPVYLYYLEGDPGKRRYRPVVVRPSVAQAAMIGNPVSMPRVIQLVEKYRELGGQDAVQVIQVTEQEIMDAMLVANRNGHVACTQGGECLAGMRRAIAEGKVPRDSLGIMDATAHAIKFAVFQEKYFEDAFEPEYEIVAKEALRNAPRLVDPGSGIPKPVPGLRMEPSDFARFVEETARKIAAILEIGDE